MLSLPSQKHFIKWVLLVFVVLICNPSPAQAYTDPGSGAFLMQAVLALVTGTLFFFKVIRTRIAAFFRRNKQTPPAVNAEKNP